MMLLRVMMRVFVAVFFPAFPCEIGKDEESDNDRDQAVDKRHSNKEREQDRE